MVEQDTIKLLRECDAGVKMGTASLGDVINSVSDAEFKKLLSVCKAEHENLETEISTLLDDYEDEGKEPNAMAKGMAKAKTNIMLSVKDTDETIADLMTDGCNMGVKSLNKYLNKYKAADEVSKDIAKRLINLEEQLVVDIRKYL